MQTLFYFIAGYLAIFTVIAAIFCIGFLLIGGSKVVEGYLNQTFALKQARIIFLQVSAVTMLVLWLFFFLPFIGILFGIDTLASHDTFKGTTIFQSFTIDGQTGNYYFLILFTGILGVKAALLILDLCVLLKKKHIKVIKAGMLNIVR